MWYDDLLCVHPTPWTCEKGSTLWGNKSKISCIFDANGDTIIDDYGASSAMMASIWDWYNTLPTEEHDRIKRRLYFRDIAKSVGDLSSRDKDLLAVIITLLELRLGSLDAAKVWLNTPGRGFDGTPLEAIRGGAADLVLEVLNERASTNPPYA